jgi:hypothetical protein
VKRTSGIGAPSGLCSRIALVLAAALALVLVFGVTVASAAAPIVAVNNASSVEYTTAHVSGEVDPQGQATTYRFQYVDEGTREFELGSGFSEWEFAETGKEGTIEGGSQTVEADLNLQPATTYYLRLVAENAEGATEAVASSTFTTKAITQPTVSIEGPTAVTGTTAHFTGHIEPNAPAGNPAAFDVDWHFECNPGCPGLSGGQITADSSNHTVEADATGLLPGTAYEVTLSASNGGGTASAGPESFSTATIAPQIVNPQAAPNFTEASLVAQISPGGLQTTYHFEYGPTSSYGQSTPATVIPAGSSPVGVEASIFSLSPASEYHYRVVAENSIESVVSADQTFSTRSNSAPSETCPNELNRTGLSAVLPDCRAYEQVSPANKSGNDAGAPGGEVVYAYGTPDGNAILYGTRGPLGATQRGIAKQAISRRSATGWSSQAAFPGGSTERLTPENYINNYSMPSADLSKIAFSNTTALVANNPASNGTSTGLYLSDTIDQSLEWISEPQTSNPIPAPGSIPAEYFQPAGGSPDLSTVYFASGATLVPEDEGRVGWDIYEYTNGQLKSAGTLPDGSLDPGGATPANSSDGPLRASGLSVGHPEETANQVSADGSTFYFISGNPTELYVRRDGISHLVSRSELTGEKAPSGVAFVAPLLQGEPTVFAGSEGQTVYGSADGSIAYFQASDQLTTDAPNDNSLKMYRYDVGSGTVSYIPNVSGTIVAASEDGQRFLFMDGSQIAVWDHGIVLQIVNKGAGNMRPAKATASGSAFVFTTSTPLPGSNNGGTTQIYHYDVASRTTTCVSCSPAGVASGPAAMSSVEGGGRNLGYFDGGHMIANRGMTEDGKHVFFDTPAPLVPRDTDGTRDVYEWSEGSGIRLISSGKSEEGSYFLESSANGDDVFFATSEGLVPGDTDSEYDVYDARVSGGFQSSSEVAACSGESCQGSPSVPRIFGAPGTVAFSGPGNPTPHAVVKPKPKPLTRAQKLAKALKACRKAKSRRARVACERKAHRAYGAAKPKSKAKSHKGGK